MLKEGLWVLKDFPADQQNILELSVILGKMEAGAERRKARLNEPAS
jgi:hypothetical protein